MSSRRPQKKKSDAAASRMDWPLVERILACDAARVIYLHGVPGIGKTYAALHFGLPDAGVYAVTMTPETPASELLGHYVPRGMELVWQDGPIITAMREGARFVVNEASHAGHDVMAILHVVLESAETAVLTLPTTEVVRPHPNFRVVLTDNCPPEELPEALRDRFDCRIEITEPHPAALDRLDPALRRAAERTFGLEENRRASVRAWHAVQRFQQHLGLADACLAVFGAARGRMMYEAIMLAETGAGRPALAAGGAP